MRLSWRLVTLGWGWPTTAQVVPLRVPLTHRLRAGAGLCALVLVLGTATAVVVAAVAVAAAQALGQI